MASGARSDATFVEVSLRVPGKRHAPTKRSASVSEKTNPQWENATFDL